MTNYPWMKIGRLKTDSYPQIIRAALYVKAAAACANAKTGRLTPEEAENVQEAVLTLIKDPGDLLDLPIMRLMGVPLNTAVTEAVLAKTGSSLTEEKLNISQYTADLTVTISNLAALMVVDELIGAAGRFAAALEAKAEEFSDVVKCGRSSLQDSLPVTLGDEFAGWAAGIRRLIGRLEYERLDAAVSLLGAGEVGEGLDIPEGFADEAVTALRELTGFYFRKPDNVMDALDAVDRLALIHGTIQAIGMAYWRIMHDIEFLTSGPRGGIREITLPAVAPGSSIMPGKINPTVAQLGALAANHISSNAAALASSAQSAWLGEGSRSTTALKAVIDSGSLLARTMDILIVKVIQGIGANRERALKQAEASAALLVVVEKALGASVAERVALRMDNDGIACREALILEGILSEAEASELLDVGVLATPGAGTHLIERFRSR